MTAKGPCLYLSSEDARLTTFTVSHDDEPDWNVLLQTPSLQLLHVHDYYFKSESDLQYLLKVAFAIKSHPGITKIKFQDCNIDDLGALCVAISDKGKLDFDNCSLGRRAAMTLRLLLETNSIERLVFERCGLPNEVDDMLAEGMRTNQSLKTFQYTSCPLTLKLVSCTFEMITTNHCIQELGLTLSDSDHHWDLFHAIEERGVLQGLRISTQNQKAAMNLQSMRALMMMCLAMDNLRKLDLTDCVIDRDALAFLARTLSRSNEIDELILSRVAFPFPRSLKPLIDIDFGSLKVEKLVLSGIDFEWDTFSQMMDALACNRFIKHLDLSSIVTTSEEMQKVCTTILQTNVGPSELVFDKLVGEENLAMLIEALQVNSSVKALTVNIEGSTECLAFAQGLANMTGLRTLVFGDKMSFSDEFLQAVQESLRNNTTLWTLSILDGGTNITPCHQKSIPDIRLFLAINRVGRHRLLSENSVPLGLWPTLLARLSHERDGIYFVLTGVPELVRPFCQRIA